MHPLLGGLNVTHKKPDEFDRSLSIGGTDIGVICGVNPYEDIATLFKRKLGLLPPKAMNAAMEWGLRHEAAILKKYHDGGAQVAASNEDAWFAHPAYPGVMISNDTPFAHASPDGFDVSGDTPLVLEVKTANPFAKKTWGQSETTQYPLWYKYQIMWYLYNTGLEEAKMLVLIGLRD